MAKPLINWERIVTWDIETLINCIIVCFKDYKTGKKKSFTLYDSEEYTDTPSELHDFLNGLQGKNYTLVGFNSIGFDHQVIEYFMNNCFRFADLKSLIDSIYEQSQRVITTPDDDKFSVLLPEWSLKHKRIDLFKQKHYDRKGASLKWLQFSMRYPRIEEMPLPHDVPITKEQIEDVVSYCFNDVDSTEDFFVKNKFETQLREALSNEYGKNLLSASEPRIAKEIFGKFLCEEMGIDYGMLRTLKTLRGTIKFKDIIFPYTSFYTEPFKKVLEDISNAEVDATHGSKDKFEYSFTYKDVPIDLGLGGIHGCIKSGIYESNEEYMILDIDASSYYPNLAIQNNTKPEHLGDSFLKVYNNLYQERKTIDKKDPRNYVYKIVLNSCYGLSKEFNSYIYDPKFTYTITINGQLSLLMLTEMLGEFVKDLTLLQLNTDGISIKFKRKDLDRVKKICGQFEKVSKQTLEYAEYKKMVIVDVNNYLAVTTYSQIKDDEKANIKAVDIYNKLKAKDPATVKEEDGKYFIRSIKKKGLFETELDYHKNPSFLIIPKALSEVFINGGDYKEFINKHDDIYDFCGGVKVKSNFTLNLYRAVNGFLKPEKQQKVTRFYASNDGGFLFKDFDDGRIVGVLAKKKVEVMNNYDDKHLHNINREFYITKTEEILNNIWETKE
jgi:hypothetical protein